jgi:phage gp37-like protein
MNIEDSLELFVQCRSTVTQCSRYRDTVLIDEMNAARDDKHLQDNRKGILKASCIYMYVEIFISQYAELRMLVCLTAPNLHVH